MGMKGIVRGMVVKPSSATTAPKKGAKSKAATPSAAKFKAATAAPTAPTAAPTGAVRPSILLNPLREVLTATGAAEWPKYLRASSLSDYCPRAEALVRLFGDPDQALGIATGYMVGPKGEQPDLPMHLAVTFAIGTAVHEYMQNAVLGPAGLLYGRWRCRVCGEVHGGKPVAEWVQRPKVCAKGHAGGFDFVEAYAVDEELLLSGHIDGLISGGSWVAGLEIKTISDTQFSGLKAPLPQHLIQANIYMHLFGLDRMLFLYLSKGWTPANKPYPIPSGSGYELGPAKEFLINKDPRVIGRLQLAREQVIEVQREAAAGLPLKSLPKNLAACKTETSARAKTCAVCDVCFSMGGSS